MRIASYIAATLMLATAASACAKTDAFIRECMITESVNAYQGACPCPWSKASNGTVCGERSSWSRHPGKRALCFHGDITQGMVDEYREFVRVGTACHENCDGR